jgi:hypothetical protein
MISTNQHKSHSLSLAYLIETNCGWLEAIDDWHRHNFQHIRVGKRADVVLCRQHHWRIVVADQQADRLRRERRHRHARALLLTRCAGNCLAIADAGQRERCGRRRQRLSSDRRLRRLSETRADDGQRRRCDHVADARRRHTIDVGRWQATNTSSQR